MIDKSDYDIDYRSHMDGPMEDLSVELCGLDGKPMSDKEIIERATKKIKLLKKLLLSSGMNENILDLIMKE